MDQEKMGRLTRKILMDGYRRVELVSWKVRQDTPHEDVVNFHGVVSFCGEQVDIHVEGTDFLTAVFEAFRRKFGERFPSLKAWREPTSFHTHEGLNFELLTRQGGPQRFRFTVPLKDMEKDDALVVTMVQAVEFFVNAERAYAASWQSIKDAAEHGRSDLVQVNMEHIEALIDVADFQEVVALVRAGRYPSL